MVGLFINTLPVRIHCPPALTLAHLLKQVQQRSLEGQPHHYSPLWEVQSQSELGRELLDHILVFENYPLAQQLQGAGGGEAIDSGYQLTDVQLFEQTNYDLTLVVVPGEEIHIKFEYNLNRYERATIEQAAGHLQALLEQLVADTGQQVGALSMLSAQEQHQLLEQFDNTHVAYPADKTVVDLFEEQVERTPGNIALCFQHQRLTYQELDEQSNQLAHHLRAHGVGPDHIVALWMDRSPQLLMAMLAVLKAGGAYLPLDIDHPQQRIQYLLEDSRARLLVSTKDCPRPLPECSLSTPLTTLWVEQAQLLPTHRPARLNRPSDLCYLIYTSGTTGAPKGVMVEHVNLVRLFFNQAFPFAFSERDVWSMFHSPCFDFSVWEMYGALLFGGKLVVVPKAVARDPEAFLGLLAQQQVSVLNQTPSAFYALMGQSQRAPLPALRYVIFGGEALSPGKLGEWSQSHPRVQLINMYGITETTVHVTYKQVGPYEMAHNISNVGKPLATLSVCLLDEQQQPVPGGVVGELYVGGAGVTRGYLGQQELTGRKFITHPHRPGQRLYRSGDLARVLPDGNIEYLGRLDEQVKLRGYRIELGEIESRLAAHQQVEQAVVALKQKQHDKYLVAYYVAQEEISSAELRGYLLEGLPDYMVPAHFVRLEHIPLTTNGKANKKALPEPELLATEDYVAPTTDIERKLVEIWAQVLKLEQQQIGTNKSFFELGGHSLRATVLINKIAKELQVEVGLKEIFGYPTIRQQASFIHNIQWLSRDEVENVDKDEVVI
jgi:amino acid adenylation domain-containing protein